LAVHRKLGLISKSRVLSSLVSSIHGMERTLATAHQFSIENLRFAHAHLLHMLLSCVQFLHGIDDAKSQVEPGGESISNNKLESEVTYADQRCAITIW
jgi:hypothetical protein